MSDQLDHRDVLLYVNSERIVRALPPDTQDAVISSLRGKGQYTFTAIYGWAGHGAISGSTLFDSGRFGGKPIRAHALSEEENAAIQLVLRMIEEKRKTLHIVDVGKESPLRRVIQEHLHHLRRFPVLVRPDGRRLEGIEEFTPENLKKFLSD